ncbi:hypothetical protein CFOL_v3_21834 [Cephalotus follicularis]|uniref:DNA-binding protein BIN4 n=1 Tax=Cephalotus follicularis TaxID=3775 RepID=A0A1Q3CDP0_CEPFO|nr:hypothetical protein CFOL_v3_21834 [Cephalotus follicularis]
MSYSREESPDWLRCFQAPTHSSPALSSDSNSSPIGTPLRVDNHDQVADQVKSEKHLESHALNHSVLTLSSDSEACPDNSPLREEKSQAVLISRGRKSPRKKALNAKSPKKNVEVDDQTPKKEKDVNDNIKKGNGGGVEVSEEELIEKHIEPHVSTSQLPLLLSEKVQRSKVLVECEGESIDLSGDMGAVGRIVIHDTPSGNQEMYLDLKGTIYKTTIVPSRTFCIVSFGQSEAKIEAIMDDFIQLKPLSNVYEAETMVEGTLEGFSFDSEDEAEKMAKIISHEGIEEEMKGKRKADKTSGEARKRAKSMGGKPLPPKKVKKKAQVKKTKTRK